MNRKTSKCFGILKDLHPNLRKKRFKGVVKRYGLTIKDCNELTAQLAHHAKWESKYNRSQQASAKKKAQAYRLQFASLLKRIAEHDIILPFAKAVRRLPKASKACVAKMTTRRNSEKQAKWLCKSGDTRYSNPKHGLVVIIGQRRRAKPFRMNRDRFVWDGGHERWVNIDMINSQSAKEQWRLIPIWLGFVPDGWMDKKPS